VSTATSATPLALRRNEGFWHKFRRSRFARAVRRNPLSILGLVVLTVLIAMILLPEAFTSYNPTRLSLGSKFIAPNAEHIFGTDHLGMDVFARIVYGARTTAWVVVVVMTIAVGIGVLVGATAGYVGGWVDDLFMRFTDIVLAFPSLILAIALNAALGRGLLQTMLAVGLSWWPSYARLVRSQVLAVKNEEHVLAAKTLGANHFTILTRYILWNGIDPIIVTITVDVGFVALATAGLSFLGLGAEPPTPEWGRMVAEGRDYLLDQWWVSTFPGMALFMVVIGFNLLGEIVRDWLDPGSIGRE
jgi:peptide/nickel transport system permease protein